MKKYLILGGARSGKSARAQSLAENISQNRIYIATAEAGDEEMAARIARHQADRGNGWRTIEAPLDISDALGEHATPNSVCLVDCLTLWLSNLMHSERDAEAEIENLCSSILSAAGPTVLVSNEVGLGLVPETPLGREFCDAQGRLNQRVAAVCSGVEFVAAGLPLSLKG